MGSSGDIKEAIWQIKGLFYDYFNPVGRLYIQMIFLCRVVVLTMIIDDIFDGPELECDTNQVGCTLNCINRFSPINHQRIWEMELFLILITCTIFSVFHYFNKQQYTGRDEKQKITSSLRFKEKQRHSIKGDDKKVIVSRITRAGYLAMLIVRFVFEIGFLWVENQLGKHQSQNTEFWSAFNLKESWICPTNNVDDAAQESLDRLLPAANRSEIFWTNDLNVACLQQQVTVTCWIPFSRMKTYGLWFMYYVLCLQTTLTAFELLYELSSQCMKKKKSPQGYSEAQTLKLNT